MLVMMAVSTDDTMLFLYYYSAQIVTRGVVFASEGNWNSGASVFVGKEENTIMHDISGFDQTEEEKNFQKEKVIICFHSLLLYLVPPCYMFNYGHKGSVCMFMLMFVLISLIAITIAK